MITREVMLRIMNEHELLYGVIVESTGMVLLETGSAEQLPCQGLVSTLIGNEQAIVRLNQFLDGQTQPKLMAQRNVIAYVLKPEESIIMVFFGLSRGEMKINFRHALLIHQSVKNEWQRINAGAAPPCGVDTQSN
jgi:hypothetical protein